MRASATLVAHGRALRVVTSRSSVCTARLACDAPARRGDAVTQVDAAAGPPRAWQSTAAAAGAGSARPSDTRHVAALRPVHMWRGASAPALCNSSSSGNPTLATAGCTRTELHSRHVASRAFGTAASDASIARRRKLGELFLEFDSLDDNDGRITVTELSRVVRDVLPVTEYAQANLERMFTVADIDGNGFVDFDEFCALFGDVADEDLNLKNMALDWVAQSVASEASTARLKKLRELFDQFDSTDVDDGAISATELSRVLRELLSTERYASADVNRMMHLADADNSGNVDFHEFCLLFGGLSDEDLTLENCAEFWLGEVETDSDGDE